MNNYKTVIQHILINKLLIIIIVLNKVNNNICISIDKN